MVAKFGFDAEKNERLFDNFAENVNFTAPNLSTKVKSALAVLKEFYAKAAEATALMQQPSAMEDAPGTFDEDAEFFGWAAADSKGGPDLSLVGAKCCSP